MAVVPFENLEHSDGAWRLRGASNQFTGDASWVPPGGKTPVIIRFMNGVKSDNKPSDEGTKPFEGKASSHNELWAGETNHSLEQNILSKKPSKTGETLKATSRTGNTAYLVGKGESVEIDLESEAPAGQLVSYRVVTSPKLGKLSILGNGKLVYTPFLNAKGEDSVGFLVSDSSGKTSGGLISLMVGVKPVTRDTSIFIVIDSSLSMAATASDLYALKNNELRESLTQFYGSKEIYENKVRVISSASERTFAFLNASFPSTGLISGLFGGGMTAPAPGKECVVIVFQDEAHPDYHNPYDLYSVKDPDGWIRPHMVMNIPGTIWAAGPVDQNALPIDIINLRRSLSSGYFKRYCGIVMALYSPEFPAFSRLVDAVFRGEGPFSSKGYNLKEYASGEDPKLRLVPNLPHAAGSRYYFERLRVAAMEAGLAIPNVLNAADSDGSKTPQAKKNKNKEGWSSRG